MSGLPKVIARAILFACMGMAGTGCGLGAREAVVAGAVRWQLATGLTAPVPRVTERWTLFTCGPLKDMTGCYNLTTGEITINVARTAPEVARTGVHEWGHRLGAGHGGHGVMSPQMSTPRSGCITRWDVDEVCAGPMGPCPWRKPECP